MPYRPFANLKFGTPTRLKRVIGTFDDGLPGPLIIAISGIHGNESMPYKAIDYVLKMLEVEHVTNPEFRYKGRFVGLCGNLAALKAGRRFIDKDMNRIWSEELIELLSTPSYIPRNQEERELQALWRQIHKEVKRYPSEQVVILDFHTTSAEGGIFCMPAHDDRSLELAFELYIPVVEGLMDTVPDSCLSFMTESHLKHPTVAISIEVGQHEDPNCIYVAIASIINTMRAIGSVNQEDVESRHDDILKHHATGLPRLSRLYYIHNISPEDEFKMLPGFKNFQMVTRGTTLAHDRRGAIHCQEDSILLMPLYQAQGSEGFFLMRKDPDFGSF